MSSIASYLFCCILPSACMFLVTANHGDGSFASYLPAGFGAAFSARYCWCMDGWGRTLNRWGDTIDKWGESLDREEEFRRETSRGISELN